MKKQIRIICTMLSGLLFLCGLSSCSNSSKSITHPETTVNIAAPRLHYYYYDSVGDFYKELENFPEYELETIRNEEKNLMSDTSKNTFMSEMEKGEGIFNYVRNKLLEEKVLLFPFYKGVMLSPSDIQVITLHPAEIAERPSIRYNGFIEDSFISFRMHFYEESLIEEANEQGASWLMSKLNPDGLNVYNYEEYNKQWNEQISEEYRYDMSVYEKVFSLGDRDVKAMVIDQSLRVGTPPLLTIYFVYDDLLIDVSIRLDKMNAEEILADTTFNEVYLPDSTVVRDTPGKGWSKWSTRPYPPSPDNIPQPDNPDAVSVPDSATLPSAADTVPSTSGGDVPSVPDPVTPPDAVPTAVNP